MRDFALRASSHPPCSGIITSKPDDLTAMVREMALRFLGTSSQTSVSRNYSSLLVKLDHQTVMVDCGESTQRQLQQRAIGGEEKLKNISHILITHMHQDHVLGLVPLLCTLMGPSTAAAGGSIQRPRVEIFGPSGLRALVRTTLTACYTSLSGYYAVHELLWPGQQITPTDAEVSQSAHNIVEPADQSLPGAIPGPSRVLPNLPQHDNELPGRDIFMDQETSTWKSFAEVGGCTIHAAPILHRCPALGYVFQEPCSSSQGLTTDMLTALDDNAAALREERGIRNPRSLLGRLLAQRETIDLPDGRVLEPPALDIAGRKFVVLGDTYDATGGLNDGGGMLSLASDADVLVHESTNAVMPAHLSQSSREDDEEEVQTKARARGHSTPQVAGQFAGRIGAKQLLLNHFSIRYPRPTGYVGKLLANGHSEQVQNPDAERKWRVMQEIERQATEAWHAAISNGSGAHNDTALKGKAVATFDGYLYRVAHGGEAGTESIADAHLDKHQAASSAEPVLRDASERRGRGRGQHRPRGGARGRGRGDNNGCKRLSSRV